MYIKFAMIGLSSVAVLSLIVLAEGSSFHLKTNDDETWTPSPEVNVLVTTDDESCGTRKSDITSRKSVEPRPSDGEFPWIAAIFNKTDGKYVFHCSGTLIHPKVVLTANRCMYRKKSSQFMVVLNGNSSFSVENTTRSEKRGILEIISHPLYATSGWLSYDVALLVLDKPFEIGPDPVNTLCLPPSDVSLVSAKCLVSGWEENEEQQGGYRLTQVEVSFINHTHCQDRLRRSRLGENFRLDKSFICAGQNWKDPYRRDSGSPLMCATSSDDERYFQAGIVSWDNGYGLEHSPGVYANVAEVKAWMSAELSKLNLGKSNYAVNIVE